VAYKDMHTLYEAEQKRADKLSRDEAARELGYRGLAGPRYATEH